MPFHQRNVKILITKNNMFISGLSLNAQTTREGAPNHSNHRSTLQVPCRKSLWVQGLGGLCIEDESKDVCMLHSCFLYMLWFWLLGRVLQAVGSTQLLSADIFAHMRPLYPAQHICTHSKTHNNGVRGKTRRERVGSQLHQPRQPKKAAHGSLDDDCDEAPIWHRGG